MDVRLEQRSDPVEPVSCAYCRGPLADDSRAAPPCARCGVVLHGECLSLNGGRCTTVGCAAGDLTAPRTRPRLARVVDSGWVWAAVVSGLALEPFVEEAGRWLHVALTVTILGLVVRRAASGVWSIGRARLVGLSLLGLALAALDLRALRNERGFDGYLLLPALTALGVVILLGVTRRLAGRAVAAATTKESGKDEAAAAAWQGPAVVLGAAVLAALGWRAADVGTQWLADARAAWSTRGDVEDLRSVLLDHSRWDDVVRNAAERALDRLDRADLNQPLLTMLGEGDDYLRRSAGIALGMNAAKDPALVPALVERLDAEESELARLGLVVALHRYAEAYPEATRVALPALARALEDDDTWTRINAIQALVALGDPAAVPHLAPLLSRREADDRIGGDYRRPDLLVARLLPKLGEPGRAALREAAASHPDPDVRERAASELERR